MGDAQEFDAGALVDAMAPLLKLELSEAWRTETIVHIKVAARLAAILLDPPFADDDEPAAVFKP